MIVIKVVVGVILNRQKKQVYLSKRQSHQSLAGLWEFPGGKVEASESNAQALVRELQEEWGIVPSTFVLIHQQTHQYTERVVDIQFYLIEDYIGEISAQEGQQIQAFDLKVLPTLDLPPANAVVVDKIMALYS